MEAIETTIRNLAKKYIRTNPITQPNYIISSADGVKRNHDYRYELRPEDYITNIPNFHYIAARATLLRNEQGETAFYVNPVGPVRIYLNGQLVYQSIRLEETEPSTGRRFTVQTECENEIIVVMRKTNLGIGTVFGTGSVKGDPFLVFQDVGKRWEGWQFSTSFGEIQELAQLNWQSICSGEEGNPHTFFTAKSGNTLYAKALVGVNQSGNYRLEGLHPETKLFVDGIEVSHQHIHLTTGSHPLILQIRNKDERLEQLCFKDADGKQYPIYSAMGLNQTWSYLGPVNDQEGEYLKDVMTNHTLIQNIFWQLSPTLLIRPIMETTLFGQWNYPLGVTLNGLFNYAQHSNDKKVFNYVHAHMSFCVNLYEYSLWDKQHFGAPSVNHCISMIDSLDDCGSMAYTLLRIHAVKEVKGCESLIKDVADYILFQQERLSDKTLYRDASHSDLMVKTLWADDIYMSLPFLTEYYLQTGYESVLHEIYRQFKRYFHYLYIPEKKMLSHVYSVKNQRATEVCWGRGNGWVFLSLTLALERLSETSIFPLLQDLFAQVAEAYTQARGTDYFWHQVLDDPETYAETSCTAIMLFAFAKNNQYQWTGTTALSTDDLIQTWEQLVTEMIDEQYNLAGVCRGSAYSFDPDYYKYELLPRINDTHGIGIVITAGCELMTLIKKEALKI